MARLTSTQKVNKSAVKKHLVMLLTCNHQSRKCWADRKQDICFGIIKDGDHSWCSGRRDLDNHCNLDGKDCKSFLRNLNKHNQKQFMRTVKLGLLS